MKKYVRILLWFLVLVWMAVIFSFSMESADESSSTSAVVIRWLLEHFDQDFPSLSSAEQFEEMEAWSFAIRKTAHFLVYTVLGLLVSGALSVDLPIKRTLLAALIFGFLYAVSDEIHQSFVPGRACQFRDVCIDTAGVLLGSGVFALLRFLRGRSRSRR